MKQLEDEKAHSGNAEEQLNAMKRLLSDHEKSLQVNCQSEYGTSNLNKSSVGVSILVAV